MSKEYLYEIGEIVNELEIIEKLRMKDRKYTTKGYKVKCIKDGYEYEAREGNLKHGYKCPVCANRVIIKGINDISTVRPDLVKYFLNIEDAFTKSVCSSGKAEMICPKCKSQKTMLISNLSRQDYGCHVCGDGISYPEKFISNLLKQLKVDFISQYSTIWSNTKRYDFYIPVYNMIIETHGLQHYEQTGGFFNKPIEEEKENDLLKEKLAKENKIDLYIVLDCRDSSLQWIKNSVLNSELSKFFNFDNIDWSECAKSATSSLVFEVSKYWKSKKENETTSTLASLFDVRKTTIIQYLKKGTELGWCDYNPKEELRKAGVKSCNKINGTR